MAAQRATIKFRAVTILLVVLPILGFSQSSFLARKITLNIPKCSLEVALSEIEKAGRFRFSYDAGLIPVERQVQINAKNLQIGKVINDLLGKEVGSREIGNHVILVRKRSLSLEKKSFPTIEITGIILDFNSRTPLADATVFEIENKKSAISANNGQYKLTIPTGKKIRGLTFCKSGYADTVIFISQVPEYRINMLLRPVQEQFTRLNSLGSGLISLNYTDSLGIVNWLVPGTIVVNAQNLEVRSSGTLQASVIPYLGTNGKVAGSITNRLSVNLLAGYNGGVKGFEIGGLLNITRKEMGGVQIGGLCNIVGGRSRGLQIGGLFNFDLGKFQGVQAAGLFNYVPDTINGLQISLATNIAAKQSNCWQVSALFNLAMKDVRKAQVCGLVNYGHNVDGIQFAGLLNIARNHNDGLQIAGILNYATIVNGLQIGLVNVSNTVERGLPIGLFSYVQEGYHVIEVSGNEVFPGNVAFRSGTKTFYNFVEFGIGAGYKLHGSYGIGTIFTLKKKLSMNLDASAGFVYHPVDTTYQGLLVRFIPALEYRFAKHFAIFGGPAYNFFLFSKGKPSATSRGLSTYDFYFKSTENASIQMWIGGALGVRF